MNKEQLHKQLDRLEPYKEVHDNPHVQRWVEDMNQTLVEIEQALMRSSYDTKEVKEHLQLMGLAPPKTTEDEVRLYMAFRLMLGFLRRKLSLLETQSVNYEKTKRKILELGTNTDIGSLRSVGR